MSDQGKPLGTAGLLPAFAALRLKEGVARGLESAAHMLIMEGTNAYLKGQDEVADAFKWIAERLKREAADTRARHADDDVYVLSRVMEGLKAIDPDLVREL